MRSINVHIVPRPAPIDHTFRFYEPETSNVTLTLPCFSNVPLSSYPNMSVVCSDPLIIPEIAENQVLISLRTAYSTHPQNFNLYIYQDSFMNNLLASAKVVVQTLALVDVETIAGKPTTV